MYYLGIGLATYKIIIAVVCVISIILIKTIHKVRAYRVCKVIKDVEREKKKLISNRDFLQQKIDATDHKTQKVSDIVFGWLKEVDKLVQEVENVTLIAEPESIRYNIEMLNKIKALNIKCEFEPFSNPIPSLEHFSSGNFVCFEPIKETSDRLLEALQNRNFYKIGLYGKRGSGKTKLVKAVAEKARYLGVFDAVLFFTVSQNPNVKQIQDEIADLLNLKFDKNTEVGRSREIYLTLERMDRPVLVILDDVWENLDLEELGIPCNNNRCKVLLTTHSKQEFALMNCQEVIPLGPLSIEESWTLFKKHSGIDNESSTDLLNVAREVAIECQGLPRTIKDVGSSLRSKPIEEWKASLESLRYAMTQYDIFISFRGKDTRDSFTGFLYDALCRERFKTFMDDEGLKGGDGISSSLIKAIEASKISIVVFSKKFAHSAWCLDELVTILKCKKTKNQQILPIFYKVEPSDVRHQKNSYERGMAKQVKRFGDDFDKLKKWRSALFEVASLSGITYNTGYEYKLVHTIVERVNNQI
ncbi:unnamed protein product [Trifolium pratense]|uniref:Uncharacterized protein n=1 Tax=Trifolium pratense TaxID=57577 RepID=A0ACB0LY37_TRIPR|nr:unnamed protein product [Trifolium pratense]